MRLLWLAGAAVAGTALWALLASRPPADRPVVRMAITLPSPESVEGVTASAVAVSPDRTQLAYVASRGERTQLYSHGARTQLYLRALDRLESIAIPGTEGAQTPFFSPDGQWLGFCSGPGSIMKRVPVGGGTPLLVGKAENRGVGFARGASWCPDGTVVFAPDATSPLYRVKADGGAAEPLTTLDADRHETSHRMPECLPDGQGILFTVKVDDTVSFDDARVEVLSLRTRERSVLVAGGTSPRYAAGHLVYERAGSLWAAPFDPKVLKLTGPSVLALEGVSNAPDYGRADFAVSQDGSLVYVPGAARGVDRRLVRVTRAGKVSPLTDARRGFEDLRLSPDGRKLALDVAGANNQVWIYDLERKTLRPQTRRFSNMEPIWTPDGTRLAFGSDRQGPSLPLELNGGLSIFWEAADGSGNAERLATTPRHWLVPRDWTADGKTLLFQDLGAPRVTWALSVEGDRQPRPVLQAQFNQWQARLSPSGRWLAYVSDESARDEVYVSPYPNPKGRTLVSTDGGSMPVWSRNGRELFYREGDRMMAVAVTSEGVFTATKPRPLFERATDDYDVTPDGDFLMIEPGESDGPQTQINVVLNWIQEVRQRVAAHR